MYTFNSRIRYSELDESGYLAVPKIIDYFQDCSCFQSETLGVGRTMLEERDLAWVLNFWQIVIQRRPKQMETVEIGTFPYEFKNFMGMRNFFMKDENGAYLAMANSLWSLLDMQTGRPVKVGEEITSKYQLETPLSMEYATRKVTMPSEMEARESLKVRKEHIDTNNHMNNAQYVVVAMNYIPCRSMVKEIRIEYKKQAYLEDTIFPFVATIENGYAVSLRDKDGAAYVNMHILTD